METPVVAPLYVSTNLSVSTPSSSSSIYGDGDSPHAEERVGELSPMGMQPVHRAPTPVKKKPVPLLPPCRVCGEWASGLHYGVNTCEACKGFFRRSLVNSSKYVCNKDEKCDIMPGRRNNCAYCRHQKCMRLGMSKQAIKTGRYTHSKRTRDIQEVKRLMEKKEELGMNHEEVNNIVRFITKSVEGTDLPAMFGTNFVQKYADKLRSHQRSVSAQNEFLPIRDLSREEHLAFYNATGIDIDKRKDALKVWSQRSGNMVYMVIKLAKGIPGYSGLPLADQISLIKGARAELLTVIAHKTMDTAAKCFVSKDGVRSYADVLKIYNNAEYVSLMFKVGEVFQKLSLTATEYLIVLGIILMSPDRAPLSRPDLVDTIQRQLTSVLEFCVTMNHPYDKRLFGKVLGALTPLRELTNMSNKILPVIKADWGTQVELNPIWQEFIDESCQIE